MIIAAARLTLLVPQSSSLKGKRKAIKALKDRISHRFNVAVAEVGGQDLWQRAEVAVVSVGNDQRVLNSKMDKLINFIESTGLVEPVGVELEFIHLNQERT
ncbi:MAG: DUF503 domain-containing protein [Deltaproteobacteria bacterium]|nr:DUF503 domain-containing protein [Deltaproteobacteria bacterium]